MIRTVVNQTLDLLWGAWQAFFGVSLLIGAVNALVALGASLSFEDVADSTVADGDFSVGDALAASLTLFAVSIISLLLISVLVVMVATAARGDQPNAAEAVRAVRQRFAVIVGAVLLSAVLVVVGLALFIVPGIWVAVTLLPLLAVVVDGSDGVVASLRATYDLVRGHWLSVFALVLILGAINIGLGVVGTVPGAVGFLLSIVTNAFSSMIIATVIWFTYVELGRRRDWPGVV